MDKTEKFLAFAGGICIIILLMLVPLSLHDSPISYAIEQDVEISYYLQVNDSMNNIERYDLALLICEQACDEKKKDMWWPPKKNHCIKNCAYELAKG